MLQNNNLFHYLHPNLSDLARADPFAYNTTGLLPNFPVPVLLFNIILPVSLSRTRPFIQLSFTRRPITLIPTCLLLFYTCNFLPVIHRRLGLSGLLLNSTSTFLPVHFPTVGLFPYPVSRSSIHPFNARF